MRDAPLEGRRLADELASLSGVLVGLQSLGKGDSTRLASTGELKNLLGECETTLQDVAKRIEIVTGVASNIKKSERVVRRVLWPVKKQETLDLVASVERLKSKLTLALSGISTQLAVQQHDVLQSVASDVKQIASHIAEDASLMERQAVLDWLSTHDPSVAHQRALQSYCEHTCSWVLKAKAFDAWWDASKHSALWINGLAGYGKTVLTSFIIETLQRNPSTDDASVLYHYFDASDGPSLSLSTFLGSLTRQLCENEEPLPSDVTQRYETAQAFRKGNPKPPEVTALVCMLNDLMSKQSCPVVVLDGVDESPECEEICAMLKRFPDEQELAHVLVVSRPDTKIRRHLTSFDELQLTQGVLEDDIGRYVQARMSNEPRFKRLNETLRDHAQQTIQLKSQGMFRWAQCQLDDISKLRTDRAIRQALNALPQNLEAAYTLMLTRISTCDVQLARRTLVWLTYSPTLLKLNAVAEAATYEPGTRSIDMDDRLADPEDIVEICGSLIAYDVQTKELRLAHQSVRECLEKLEVGRTPYAMPSKVAHREMAELCLSYLLMDDFADGMALTAKALRNKVKSFPLLEYAVDNWIYHIQKADAEADLQEDILRLLTPNPNPRFEFWLQVVYYSSGGIFQLPGSDNRHVSQPHPLYYAASYGLSRTVQRLVEAGADLNVRAGRFGGTALHAACWRNHPDIVRYLLEQGADPKVRDLNGSRPGNLANMTMAHSLVELMFEHSKEDTIPQSLAKAVSAVYDQTPHAFRAKPRVEFHHKQSEYWKARKADLKAEAPDQVFEIG